VNKQGIYTTRAPMWRANMPATRPDTSGLVSSGPLGLGPRLRQAGVSGGLDVSGGNVTARASFSGIVGLLTLLGAVWAIDRYVVNVPGVGS
jgi:hypothetical protein